MSFGLSNQMVVTFKEENLVTFKHLFLKNYADGDNDNYAVYRQADVYGYISHSIKEVAEHRLTRDAWSVWARTVFRFTSISLEIIVASL